MLTHLPPASALAIALLIFCFVMVILFEATNGFHDAAAQAGAGLTRTHPSDVPMLPPVFALDHILTRGCAATAVRTLSMAGSDHRALVAEISIPGC